MHGPKKYTRTVVVEDTLKPVISLKYKGTKVPQAGLSVKWMAETASSSVNGWIIGSVASAVTGLALLGFSARKTEVPVPV